MIILNHNSGYNLKTLFIQNDLKSFVLPIDNHIRKPLIRKNTGTPLMGFTKLLNTGTLTAINHPM